MELESTIKLTLTDKEIVSLKRIVSSVSPKRIMEATGVEEFDAQFDHALASRLFALLPTADEEK